MEWGRWFCREDANLAAGAPARAPEYVIFSLEVPTDLIERSTTEENLDDIGRAVFIEEMDILTASKGSLRLEGRVKHE